MKQNIIEGKKTIKKGQLFIGTELAYELGVKVGDKINLMSQAFIATPFGGLPKQDTLQLLKGYSVVVFMNLTKILFF